ncbi:hypothetical protein V6582_09640 [Agrobacterium vitis]|uniref:hypothetical protein n=1 Tax=Agrobacterium vitis TaxID=373 RepID=UPI0030E4AEE7
MTYNETTSSYGASSSNTITAFFENRSDAEAAIERLVEAGIPRDGIRLVAGKEFERFNRRVLREQGLLGEAGRLLLPG